ncbi:cytochrome c oxidase subunit IV family [Hyaloraphidium curvatum]|nr:cytochrome c oxidase subunit IV family [Hyaloraphidium curvatum]
MFAAPARRALVAAARVAPRPAARAASTVSDAALVGLEARWGRLPECEQAAVAEKLLEKQKGDWRKMTQEEKRAAYFIAYGPHSSRAPEDPSLNQRVYSTVAFIMAVSGGIWYYWFTHRTLPETMSPEGVAELQRIIEEDNAEPITRGK